ncbi:MAG: hypothetical protein PHW74_10585 [Desulfobacca sp.]|nr:hypothetical protein [Desulfobacca sp.]
MLLNNAEIQQIKAIADGPHGELLRQVVFILANPEYGCRGEEGFWECCLDKIDMEYREIQIKKSYGGCPFYCPDAEKTSVYHELKKISICENCGGFIPEGPILNARWFESDLCGCQDGICHQ